MKFNNKRDITRRQLLTNTLIAAGGGLLGGATSSRVFSATSDYKGKLLVTLQLVGGADVTAWCDPKENVPGERKISNWADDGSIQKQAGIYYAPFANNEAFFKKYARHMLVVNGIDAQTNAHSTGVLYNWSGRNTGGAPTLTALHAAKNAPQLPLSYTSTGGFSATGGLIRFTRMTDLAESRGLLNPFVNSWDGEPSRELYEDDIVNSFVERSMANIESSSLSSRQLATLRAFKESRESRGSMTRLLDILPTDDAFAAPEGLNVPGGMSSNLKRSMQGALLIFKAGLGSAADMQLSGFDSHDTNDPWQDPLLSHVADAVDFFWSYAKELGIASRITLVIGSDFGRTNFYNEGGGKDHWNFGSTIVMGQNPAWGGRAVGLTDELHFGVPINPTTLKKAPNNGVIMTPSHVHLALRKQLGLHQFAIDSGFPLNVESVDMFNPNKRSVV